MMMLTRSVARGVDVRRATMRIREIAGDAIKLQVQLSL